MGKRKRATKAPAKKKMPKLDKVFNCPFCGHEGSVECKIDKGGTIGTLECRLCGVRYSATIGRLEEEIDVYYKWIDACDAANRQGREARQPQLTEPAGIAEVEKSSYSEANAKQAVKEVADEEYVDEEAY